MTTGLFATFPLAVGHELHLQLGRTRAIILALLGTLCVALVATSALRVDRLLAATTPHLLLRSFGWSNADIPEARLAPVGRARSPAGDRGIGDTGRQEVPHFHRGNTGAGRHRVRARESASASTRC